MAPRVVCAACASSTELRPCTGCHTTYYCGPLCQQAHWPTHKKTCAGHRRKRSKGKQGRAPRKESEEKTAPQGQGHAPAAAAAADTASHDVTGLAPAVRQDRVVGGAVELHTHAQGPSGTGADAGAGGGAGVWCLTEETSRDARAGGADAGPTPLPPAAGGVGVFTPRVRAADAAPRVGPEIQGPIAAAAAAAAGGGGGAAHISDLPPLPDAPAEEDPAALTAGAGELFSDPSEMAVMHSCSHSFTGGLRTRLPRARSSDQTMRSVSSGSGSPSLSPTTSPQLLPSTHPPAPRVPHSEIAVEDDSAVPPPTGAAGMWTGRWCPQADRLWYEHEASSMVAWEPPPGAEMRVSAEDRVAPEALMKVLAPLLGAGGAGAHRTPVDEPEAVEAGAPPAAEEPTARFTPAPLAVSIHATPAAPPPGHATPRGMRQHAPAAVYIGDPDTPPEPLLTHIAARLRNDGIDTAPLPEAATAPPRPIAPPASRAEADDTFRRVILTETRAFLVEIPREHDARRVCPMDDRSTNHNAPRAPLDGTHIHQRVAFDAPAAARPRCLHVAIGAACIMGVLLSAVIVLSLIVFAADDADDSANATSVNASKA